MAAGKKAEAFMTEQAAGLDAKMVKVFKENGVEVVAMKAEQAAAWLEIAKQTSYKIFAEKVEGGKELIEKALAVE
ncbi:ABC transporter substrate-binding protein (fragment) [Candidatus Terasakiella magnetica]